MPSYDFMCEDGHYTERFMKMSQMASTVTCATCGKEARRVFMTLGQARDAQPIEPVIVYRKQDGSFIYPGDSGPRNYPDAVRVELKTLGELRAVTREQDRLDAEIWELNREAEEAHHAPLRRERRAQLLQQLSTNFGRDFARVAMEAMDRRRQSRRYTPGNHFEIAEFDRSNREPQCDRSTQWKDRRA